jgi:hypothetical protein
MYEHLCFGSCVMCNIVTVVLRTSTAVQIGPAVLRTGLGDAVCEHCDFLQYKSLHPEGKWMVWRNRESIREAPKTPEVVSVLSLEPFSLAFQAAAKPARPLTPRSARRPGRPKRAVSQAVSRAA